MKPALTFRKKTKLQSLSRREAFLQTCVSYAEALGKRTLAISAEAETTITLSGQRFSIGREQAGAVGFNDEVPRKDHTKG